MNSIEELEASIRANLEALKLSLADSPVSFNAQVCGSIGYYIGFCHAKNWDRNLDFIVWMEKL